MAKATARKVPGLTKRDGIWFHGGSTRRFESAEYSIADSLAIKALAQGVADADQQKRALRWIVEGACMLYGETFDVDSPRASDFAQGRRFAGRRINAVLKVNTTALAKIEENQED